MKLDYQNFISTSRVLDSSGLRWNPEIGDEIASRSDYQTISILVDPQGLTPSQLRETYLWLPSVEQLVMQFEARQAFIQHVGLNEKLLYSAVIESAGIMIKSEARSLRMVFGKALENLLCGIEAGGIH